MKTLSTRIAAGFLLATMILSGAPAQTQAATNPWSWTDISNQLTVRNNRPVWAMAYANGSWFYTDGLDLWNGGQVYRYDGYTQVNITTEVRNAGLNRVDDIVTDGQSVLFLKGIVARNNGFEILKYQNGGFTNLTSVRNALNSNEGISSIKGQNGTWYIVTTKSRLFRWNGDTSQPTRVYMPTEVENTLLNVEEPTYAAGGTVPDRSVRLMMLPTTNGWLLVSHTDISPNYTYMSFYRFNGSTFTKLDRSRMDRTIDFIASNGSNVLFQSWNGGTCVTAGVWKFNGTSFQQIWMDQPASNCGSVWRNSLSNGISAWDGQSWIVMNRKDVYRVTDSSVTLTETARDYFTTAASNGNGTILVGGAESILGLENPVFPLQAKLVKLVNDGGASQNNNQNTQTSNGISAWSWIEPNQSSIRRDQHVTFGAGAWSDKGIKHLHIVVNGVNRNACHFNNAMGNQQCTYSIWGGEFALGTNVSVNAKITNGNDQVLWTELKTLNVTDSNSTNNPPANTNSNTNIWTWSEPETSQFKTNESAKFLVGAVDPDGIQKIEMYVNGSIWNTCHLGTAYGNQQCSVTISGSSFAAGSDVYVNAKVTDSQGNTAWSASRSYRINAANGSTTPTPSGTNPTSSWVWSAPEKSQLAKDESATWNVGAYDADGLNRVDIWVNGVVKQTCSFGTAYGNRECSFVIRANDYAAGTNVFVNAAIVDSKGETTWSASRTYSISSSNGNGSSTNGSNNLPGSIQVTSNRDNGFSSNDTITVTASAKDQNGIKRIDLLVNGTLYKTCNNAGSCSVTVGPFPQNSTISYGATVVDNAGYAIWTGYKTIYKK